MPSNKELAIAGFYDGIYLFYGIANSFLTLGLDRWWRARAAKIARGAAPGALAALDACCGTGDFTLALKKAFGPGLALTGADLSAAMLSAAKAKNPGIRFVQAEAKELPFPDGSFDLATIAFATRNLNIDRTKLLAALREFRRVLKPGGLFLNLETTRPANPAIWFLMRTYVKTVIGLLNILSPKSRDSYSFLESTILDFYGADEFSALLSEAGFTGASYKTFCPGAVAVHTARK
ncbi:MAG: ubiquinone/menaquinone biosynthesis methyltransferase [Elusimicrobiota bacterium]|nr:ubiquinone/menaquinone biosynthesis methyltransferase [Elusimicrobiota bacterium]